MVLQVISSEFLQEVVAGAQIIGRTRVPPNSTLVVDRRSGPRFLTEVDKVYYLSTATGSTGSSGVGP